MDWPGFVSACKDYVTILGFPLALIGLWKFVWDRRKESRDAIQRAKDKEKAETAQLRLQASVREAQRLEALRLGEVTAWGQSCLEVFVTAIAAFNPSLNLENSEIRSIVRKCYVDSSILIEKGRIYFNNVPHPTHGAEKEPAYRGLRPRILDFLVALHDYCGWALAGKTATTAELFAATLKAEREFMSLLQKEVGRLSAKDPEAAAPGSGDIAMQILDDLRAKKR